MRGLIDATCEDCGARITWDTNCPRLCRDCYWELMQQPDMTDTPYDGEESEAAS